MLQFYLSLFDLTHMSRSCRDDGIYIPIRLSAIYIRRVQNKDLPRSGLGNVLMESNDIQKPGVPASVGIL